MATAVKVVIHQFRQIIFFTFYFCVCQLILFQYGLRAHWSLLIFVVLLGISAYEDVTFFNQDSIPEAIVVLRIFANSIPLFISEQLIYVLKRGHFMIAEPEVGLELIGRPEQMIVRVPPTGIEILDDVLIAGYYYLIYFFNFAFFRGFIAQLQFVERMFKQNRRWSSDIGTSLDLNQGDATNMRDDDDDYVGESVGNDEAG